MQNTLNDGETPFPGALVLGDSAGVFAASLPRARDIEPGRTQPGLAERVASRMIARHGVDAAREATVRLNRMIDRGNLAGRDLWACVVHMIHERRA